MVTLVTGGVWRENSGVEYLGVGWRGEMMRMRIGGRLTKNPRAPSSH